MVSRLMWRLMPFLFLLYIVAYLDRINVSFAVLQMRGQLGLSDRVYGRAAGIFFAGYFIFQLPSNLVVEKVGIRRWISALMVAWGLISCFDDFYPRPVQLLLHAFPAGRCRSWILSRHHPLHEALVPIPRSGSCRCVVHDRKSPRRNRRQPHLRSSAQPPRQRTGRVAMDVPDGGRSRNLVGWNGFLGALRQASRRSLARRRRKSMAAAGTGNRAAGRIRCAPRLPLVRCLQPAHLAALAGLFRCFSHHVWCDLVVAQRYSRLLGLKLFPDGHRRHPAVSGDRARHGDGWRAAPTASENGVGIRLFPHSPRLPGWHWQPTALRPLWS